MVFAKETVLTLTLPRKRRRESDSFPRLRGKAGMGAGSEKCKHLNQLSEYSYPSFHNSRCAYQALSPVAAFFSSAE